jgi:site-specific DNA recombinase
VSSLHRIAAAVGRSERYVSKVIRTAFLAPDLVEAVLEGRAPTRLTPAALTDDLPLDWNEQRRRFPGLVGGNRTSQHPESDAV